MSHCQLTRNVINADILHTILMKLLCEFFKKLLLLIVIAIISLREKSPEQKNWIGIAN